METIAKDYPESYIEDPEKAIDVAYAWKPFEEILSHATKAAKEGVVGMEDVAEKLIEGQEAAMTEAEQAYDKKREYIQGLKDEIVQNILRLQQAVLAGEEMPFGPYRTDILHLSGEGEQFEALTPKELKEIRDTAFGLLGAKPNKPQVPLSLERIQGNFKDNSDLELEIDAEGFTDVQIGNTAATVTETLPRSVEAKLKEPWEVGITGPRETSGRYKRPKPLDWLSLGQKLTREDMSENDKKVIEVRSEGEPFPCMDTLGEIDFPDEKPKNGYRISVNARAVEVQK